MSQAHKYVIFTILITLLNFKSCIAANDNLEPIKITRGNLQQIPIAINDFSTNENQQLANNIVNLINLDLASSKIFTPIDRESYIEDQPGIDYIPLFAAWRQINANILVNGEITHPTTNTVKVTFAVWDVALGRKITQDSIIGPIELWRRVAHRISDHIYHSITGNEGYFNSKILYIAETNNQDSDRPIKRVACMDYDGENNYYLTDGKTHVITPVFSTKKNVILYVSYENKIPKVRIIDLDSGKDNVLLSSVQTVNFSPRMSPDGTKIALSMSPSKSITHIYEVNLRTHKVKQLTFGNSINTSPSYSPDGRNIAFMSDRTGSAHIYVMKADGTNVTRITSGPGSYTTPSWSPKNNFIAFTKTSSGEFGIGIMKPDGSESRVITTGYLVEGPSWAPNGTTLMFTRVFPATRSSQYRISKLYCIEYTGYNEREVQTKENAFDPYWFNAIIDSIK